MDLHARIAKDLGWTEAEVKSFSLVSLRDLVRTVNPKLAHVITDFVESGEHIVGEPLKPKRWRG